MISSLLILVPTSSGCGSGDGAPSLLGEAGAVDTRTALLDVDVDGGGDGTTPSSSKLRGYIGSSACKDCHESEYYYWMRTPHSYMAKTVEAEKLIDISPLNSTDLPFPVGEVSLVLGNIKKQVYLTKVGATYHFLPKQYNFATAAWEPFDADEWEPVPGSGTGEEAPRTWNDICAGCHTTGYDPAKGDYVELSVGCEECHGPGAKHAETEDKDDIVNPRSLAPELAISICAQCHARGTAKGDGYPFATEFVPGEDISEHMTLAEPRYGSNTDFFWGNGMAFKHHEQYQEFIQSRHNLLGLTCLDCHKGHRLKLKNPPSEARAVLMTVERRFLAAKTYSVCVKCHIRSDSRFTSAGSTVFFESAEAHSRHPAMVGPVAGSGEPDGDVRKKKMLCNDCHMPHTAPDEASFDMHTHTFRIPEVYATAAYGVPNGCASCHTDRSTEWALAEIRKGWLSEGLIRTHCARFVSEVEELKKAEVFLESFLAGAAGKKHSAAPAVGERVAFMEELAGHARGIIKAPDGGAPAAKEASYSVYRKIRAAEPELYWLRRELSIFAGTMTSDLEATIDSGALDALNYVLEEAGQAPLAIPEMAETFLATEDLYRKFNSEVRRRGSELFEGKGRKTKWSDWIEIYGGLKAGKLEKRHSIYVEELSEVGLISHRIELK